MLTRRAMGQDNEHRVGPLIVKPVMIIGAPRSGTSMLQKILRNHPVFWSLPSESDMIWDQFCHPALHDWDSESLDETDITAEDKAEILRLFNAYMRPASFWRPFENANVIWGFRRVQAVRKLMRGTFKLVLPLLTRLSTGSRDKRLLEKTASNCFRLGLVNYVFPDAKIVYPTRNGLNNINSLINAWRHSDRFFTYDIPVDLEIADYAHGRWKFVLPPGWRNFTNRSLAEVCAFQWQACHQSMLAETAKEKYRGRVHRLKLEELVADPETQLRALADFIEVPFDDYFAAVAKDLPVVNSPDNDVSPDKWKGANRDMIESIRPMIADTMCDLGYES